MSAAHEEAAGWLRDASFVVAAAGAGMGVDAGLPDFRGPEGFWRAFPPARRLGLAFEELANPRWFRSDPALAWSFYGWRLAQYRATAPHEGYRILRRLAARAPLGGFAFTSNVDGHFARAGFPEGELCEVHGSLHHLQCLDGCGVGILDAAPWAFEVDPQDFRLRSPLPRCPACGALLRPNVLMFGDGDWAPERSEAQHARLQARLRSLPAGARVVVVECGAGTAIPSVRRFSEALVRRLGARLVRVNPREPEVPDGQLALAEGALAALTAIEAAG